MQIYEEHQLLRRPVGAEQGPHWLQASTYCAFHKKYGHNTRDCQKLDWELERLIGTHPHVWAILMTPTLYQQLPLSATCRGNIAQAPRGQGHDNQTIQQWGNKREHLCGIINSSRESLTWFPEALHMVIPIKRKKNTAKLNVWSSGLLRLSWDL